MQTLLDHVAAQGTVAGAPFVIFHGEVNADSDGPIEICVPYGGPVTPGGTSPCASNPPTTRRSWP